MKVDALDKNRNIVEKELIISKEFGAILKYNGKELCIEKDYDIWNKIQAIDSPPDGFSCAFIMITNDCNKHCEYCYNRDLKFKHRGDHSKKQIINTIKKFIPEDNRGYENLSYKDYKYDSIHPVVRILGGEPTVSKNLSDLLQWGVINTNHKYYISTNGILMQDKNFFKNITKSKQICWALSIDKYTKPDFIKKWTENIIDYGGSNEYAYGLIIDDNNWPNTIKQDNILRTYQPQEIRYRGLSCEDGSVFPMMSDIIEFVKEARGISKEIFINKAKWYQQILTCLSYKHTENLNTGNIVLARLPVWNTLIADIACKQSSFVMNTKGFWNTAETHTSSIDLFKYRMKRSDKYYCENSHKLFWGKQNTYLKEENNDSFKG